MTAAPSTFPLPPAADEAGRLVRAAAQRMALARAASAALFAGVVLSLLAAPLLRSDHYGDVLGFAGMAAAAVWVFLGLSAARIGRRVREASALASVGRVDLAEGRATEALGSFCLLRPVTLGAAAVLARVRHGQGRHGEAARLAAFVIGRRENVLAGERRGVRLLLAEALLAGGDPVSAQAAAAPLYAPPPRGEEPLTLPEALRLLGVQIAAEAALGQWDDLRAKLPRLVPMVELMPPAECRRLTATLAEAAEGGGESFAEWAAFLRRRADVLGAAGEAT